MGAFGLAVIQKPLLEERGTACGGVVVERDVEAPPLLLISILRATDDRPYEEYDGRQKPLLEERCHEVTEWWNKKRNA